jgi:hypothetical protein
MTKKGNFFSCQSIRSINLSGSSSQCSLPSQSTLQEQH